MRRRSRIGLLVPGLALAAGLHAQEADILQGAPQTSIYVETDYSGNEALENCDWYARASELIAGGEFGAGCQVNIRIRGIINREGALLFAALVERLDQLGHRAANIVLDSRGGDADAAISIGRLVRRNKVFSQMPVRTRLADTFDAVCFSACVVIFSAGYERLAEFNIDGNEALPSRLGIHGPGQYDRQNRRYDSSAQNGEIMRVSRRLKAWFSSIGADEQLVDDMFAVPFDEIRLLSREDLIHYGLRRTGFRRLIRQACDFGWDRSRARLSLSSTRTRPSCDVDATRVPSCVKNCPRENPLAPEELGLSMEYSSQSSMRNFRWNQMA